MFTTNDLTFVVCAYGDNHNIPETIKSLLVQTQKDHIIISTSTPSDYLKEIAERFDIRLYINPERKGPGADWNFGYANTKTQLVTIAHQDDIYEPEYLTQIIQAMNDANEPVIAFTDYYELREGNKVITNRILEVKRKMNCVFINHNMRKSHFWKRRILSIGNSICCPSVTYNKKLCGSAPFDTHFINSCDYQTYVDLIEISGSFVYIPKMLVGHRISKNSATTRNLNNNIRQNEDLKIFEEFWPAFIAHRIYKLYSSSEKSNIMGESE